MSNKNTKDKQERVQVHVRMRPFTEDEIKRDNTTPVESFDTTNNVIVGNINITQSKKITIRKHLASIHY
jgi:hypothetical protein